MVRPSRRGGVPVLSRPSAKPCRVERRRQTEGRGLADAAGRDLRLAHMDEPAQEGAGGQHHGRRRQSRRPSASGRAGHAPVARCRGRAPRPRRWSGSPCRASSACMAAAVELAVGLGARPADGRPLAPVEHAELDAGGIGHPAHQRHRARRSRGRDGPCRGRRSPDCRTSRRSSRRLWVTSAVRAPIRAAAAAASQPAWPPPMTMTSKDVSIGLIRIARL